MILEIRENSLEWQDVFAIFHKWTPKLRNQRCLVEKIISKNRKIQDKQHIQIAEDFNQLVGRYSRFSILKVSKEEGPIKQSSQI